MHFLSSLDSLDATDDTSVALFGADVAHLVFQAAEPGDDQRWSTWPAPFHPSAARSRAPTGS